MDLTGNKLRQAAAQRSISSSRLRRPESDYARQRKQYDTNPRYKHDNISSMDLDMPEKMTQDFDGPGMVSRVDPILGMSLNADDGDDISFSQIESGQSPYLHYGTEGEDGAVGGRDKDRDKGKKAKGGRERPRSAARRDDGESKSSRK